MRALALRRHTMRAKPVQHLIQAGVTLGRRLNETIRIMGAIAAVIAEHGGWPIQ